MQDVVAASEGSSVPLLGRPRPRLGIMPQTAPRTPSVRGLCVSRRRQLLACCAAPTSFRWLEHLVTLAHAREQTVYATFLDMSQQNHIKGVLRT